MSSTLGVELSHWRKKRKQLQKGTNPRSVNLVIPRYKHSPLHPKHWLAIENTTNLHSKHAAMGKIEHKMSKLTENLLFGVPKALSLLLFTVTGIVIACSWGLAWCFEKMREMVVSFGFVLGPIAIALDLILKVVADAVIGILKVVTLGFYHPHFIPINAHDQTGQVLGNMSNTKEMCATYKNPEMGIGEIIGLVTRDTVCSGLRYIYPSPLLRKTVVPMMQWASLDPDPNSENGNCKPTFFGVYCTFMYGDALMWASIVFMCIGVGVMAFNLHEIVFDLLDIVMFFVVHLPLWVWEKIRRGHRHSFKEHWNAYIKVCGNHRQHRFWRYVP